MGQIKKVGLSEHALIQSQDDQVALRRNRANGMPLSDAILRSPEGGAKHH
jgi:hypothetical protein